MKNEMNDNLDEFDKYVMSFDLEDKMIEYNINIVIESCMNVMKYHIH